MVQLNPYLRFNDGKCREAMNFYKEIFGGDLTFQTVGESPMSKEMPAEAQNKIMHATLKRGDFQFFASDMMRDKATIGDNISLALNCESEEQIKTLFEKLKGGGEVFMPLEKAFWGGLFGMLTDKYGIEWMLNYQEKSEKVDKDLLV
ncbi:VOC family protein [Candidatus Pacearchaeota archaeon]|nr:VOC family protein [Candidatus Pacearchaeota archaeon]